MKQLFVDILTKMTPNYIGPTGIQYSIKNGDKTINIVSFSFHPPVPILKDRNDFFFLKLLQPQIRDL